MLGIFYGLAMVFLRHCPSPNSAEWARRALVEEVGSKVGLAVFYVPNGKSGFLLSMEQFADEVKREERCKV